MKKWEKRLIRIDHVLDDAEDKQLTGDPRVKSWLEDLRNLAYDIDDLLDEFATKLVENESRVEPGCSKARSILPSCCFRLSPCVFMFDCKMRSKIEEINQRLQEIITLKDDLSLRENNGQRSAYSRLDRRPPTTDGTELCFISREDEKRQILEWLTRIEDDRTCVDLEVIAIVGMGGVGKTALAQQVYHDDSLTYNEKAWACVSDNFDVLSITKSILEMTNRHLSCEGKTLNWLQDELKKNLSGKKFLVVLDDIWNENYDNWTTLLKPFQSGEKGSKIIITTRHLDIALMAHARPITLEVLSPDACMTLFAFHALGVLNFDGRTDLEVLGWKIVEKCKGLPLAVKALAGLLRTKVSRREWEAVMNSKIWDLPEERINILPALKLSYLHLPSYLRRCFAYCAIFPQDYEIQRDELIRWWIAEGLVEGKEGKDRWNAGLNYFNELVSRSLFQKSSSSELIFLMHDLVNDLAKLVAGPTHFSSGEIEFEHDQNNAYLARHASFISSGHIVPEKFKIYHGMKGLRSFISLSKQSSPYSYLSQKVICDLLQALKYLRVISLSHYCIGELPDCIGKLRHLRHLNLSYTNIEMLPKSIVALHNLEALMLRGCDELIKLPEDIEKLINLRYLDITDTRSLIGMPLNIGNLVGLEMLSKFVVGTENGSRLKELKNLENIGGELCIFDLHMVQEARDATDANLYTKKGICRLTMQWCLDFENFRDEELEAKVLDFLRPNQNLEILKIFFYGGLEFPSWLGSPLYVNIVHLRLHGCRRAKALPSLGQLSSLKELYIEGLNAICKVGSEFYGTRSPFMSLITLEFKDMTLWEDWSHWVGTEEAGVLFPRLEHLVIRDCPMLIGRLPSQPSSLIELEISSCPRMDALPSITSLPSLKKLKFGGCNEGLLKSLVNLTSLTTLVIEDVANLTSLSHGFTSSLIKLEKLEMGSCEKLMYLWQDRDVIGNLACLKSLIVKSCPEFIYFATGEGDIELPSTLEIIKLTNCANLEKLPSKMHTLSSLINLTVDNCPKLVSFPETGIPTSVISLNVKGCKMLQSLPRGLSIHPDEPSSGNSSSRNNRIDMMSCLQKLTIGECDSLPASMFSEGRFLTATIKTLEIMSCNGVESLTDINVDCLRSLQRMGIWGCHNLRSLPPCMHTLSHLTFLVLYDCLALDLECFPPLPPSISRFSLNKCPKIKSLPNQLHRLPYLRELAISECESITRFPDGGLPPQLQSLNAEKCWNMKQPVREWLTSLTSLEKLEIDGSIGGVGEEEDLRLPLPSSLLHFEILGMQNVKRLSSSLPPSLKRLRIEKCPKLRKLPQDGLPPSLEQLLISRCGILEERCRKPTGCYWPLIREIPCVSLLDYMNWSFT
ncbi:putative disease resistance RPP13-like protein 1 [Syzygium oleosum]|uniref:putative disease resistance RPP13-like protein 1 n=1 Tax=Syzygium oleosum TaxID=219896 RepID=UPI0024B9C036|nr:putative disease resistance RPP13-like protein 1 [Syzygium oleosum]XP_056165417.1 putative disease resistance RPP13-like protein 1 [Syzygium oleosum]XP_056165418.1 putative disease resistance RPP13-like protein 1 [Syzygium oleosum]